MSELSDKELAAEVYGLLKNEPSLATFWGAHSAHQTVRDFRVAGALMEKTVYLCVHLDLTEANNMWTVDCHNLNDYGHVEDPSLPRAIIEACVSALKGR